MEMGPPGGGFAGCCLFLGGFFLGLGGGGGGLGRGFWDGWCVPVEAL